MYTSKVYEGADGSAYYVDGIDGSRILMFQNVFDIHGMSYKDLKDGLITVDSLGDELPPVKKHEDGFYIHFD